MADLMRSGGTWLVDQVLAAAGEVITYTRDTQEFPATAVRGRTEYETSDEYGVVVGAATADFLIPDSEFPSELLEPQSGDRITAGGVVYEVLDLPGEGAWRWSGPYRLMRRIHAKETD